MKITCIVRWLKIDTSSYRLIFWFITTLRIKGCEHKKPYGTENYITMQILTVKKVHAWTTINIINKHSLFCVSIEKNNLTMYCLYQHNHMVFVANVTQIALNCIDHHYFIDIGDFIMTPHSAWILFILFHMLTPDFTTSFVSLILNRQFDLLTNNCNVEILKVGMIIWCKCFRLSPRHMTTSLFLE